ncbi:MAG: BrnA antitoxin family protein [Rhodocyclaceae bacterium]
MQSWADYCALLPVVAKVIPINRTGNDLKTLDHTDVYTYIDAMKKKSTTPIFDADTPITQGDIDTGKLVLRKRAAGRVILPKKRVTLYLDESVVDRFKEMAGARGYQTLINETLKSSMHQADIAETLRQVIREELKGRKAA